MKKYLFVFSLSLFVIQINAQDETINGTTFKQDGKVGIGTTTPAGKLQVIGNSGFDKSTRVYLTNGASDYGRTNLILTGRMQGGNDGWNFGSNARNSIVFSSNYVSSGSENVGGIGLEQFSIQHEQNTNTLGILSQTKGDTPLFTISQSGNVGIGTTSPSRKLHIYNGSSGVVGYPLATGIDIEGNGAHTGINILSSNNGAGRIYFGAPTSYVTGSIEYNHNSVVNSGRMLFRSGNSERMTILGTGNVGIGTTSPQAKLDIFGQVDGDFNGLIIDNRKTYGANSGVNETSRILLSLSENGTPNPLNRVFGIMEAGTLSETDSSNGRLSFLVRQNGNVSEKMRIMSNGDVGIGTTDTKGFKLGINGKIAATEVKVATYANWPDFVFKEAYNLPALKEVEQHIKENGHLKNIPSAEEVKKDGFFLGEMNSKLLQKIEELTLYTIEQEKKIEKLSSLKKENDLLNKKFDALEALVSKIIKNYKN